MNNAPLNLSEYIDQAAADLPAMLTRKEAQCLARVSGRTISRWIDSGRLQATKTSPGRCGRVLIPKAALVRLLSGHA